jgi:hypothetical protein
MFNQYQILASKNAKKLARAHRAPSRGRYWGSSAGSGYCTGWLQTSPTLGIVLSVIVSIAARTYFPR